MCYRNVQITDSVPGLYNRNFDVEISVASVTSVKPMKMIRELETCCSHYTNKCTFVYRLIHCCVYENPPLMVPQSHEPILPPLVPYFVTIRFSIIQPSTVKSFSHSFKCIGLVRAAYLTHILPDIGH
jgi:hypothetical protein